VGSKLNQLVEWSKIKQAYAYQLISANLAMLSQV